MKLVSAAKHVAKLILGRERIKFERVNKKVEEPPKPNIFYEDLDESKLISQNQNQFKHLVGIDGMGFSGSSAVTDFLAEFSNTTVLGGVDPRENPDRGDENAYEVDFVRDPGSLLDLERICYTDASRIKDNAIHEFIRICEDYHNSAIPLFNNDYFINLSKSFLKQITSFAFLDSPSHVSYYPKKISVNEYRRIASDYLLKILKNVSSRDFLVCDNLTAIGCSDEQLLNDYFGECKILLNWCDPRDVYARARFLPGCDWVPIDPEIFVQNFLENNKPWIDKVPKNSLITNFDDFCNDYETQSKKIMDFLGLEEKDHIDKFKYFNPKVSINNTGVWKKLENQKPIEYIFEKLKEFCYDQDNHRRYTK
ncbi:MAG: hypothetical protein K6G09_04250 [Treponema sp.]|nr:hypothetical protein [Treponema sp.]